MRTREVLLSQALASPQQAIEALGSVAPDHVRDVLIPASIALFDQP